MSSCHESMLLTWKYCTIWVWFRSGILDLSTVLSVSPWRASIRSGSIAFKSQDWVLYPSIATIVVMELWLVSLASSLIGLVPCTLFIISFGYFIVQIHEISSLVKFQIHIWYTDWTKICQGNSSAQSTT